MATKRQNSGAATATVGVVTDPDAAPAEIGRHLQDVLPELLSRRLGDGRGWNVVLRQERLPVGSPGTYGDLFRHACALRSEEQWEAVLCLTDLPLKDSDQRPLVADVALEHRVAVLSLPAFGATRLRRRATGVAVKVLAMLAGDGVSDRSTGDETIRQIDAWKLPGPFRRVTPDAAGIDVRIVASRGRWRQFVGMVRANRPWRLVLGLRTAVAAALGFSAVWLINPTIWQLGQAHGFPRLVVISLCADGAIVAWLIIYHRLWERGGGRAADRQQARLFNASTVVTLLIGVGIAFAGLLVLNLAAAYLIIPGELLAQQSRGAAGFTEYAKLTWMATSGACVVGGVGAGFESEQAVREAAYSQREAERRKTWRERSHDHADDV
jgi:hypothetical protein